MNKLFVFVFVLFLSFSTFSYAANDHSMRSMAAEQLFQYGQATYDRGDKEESLQIFSRVLTLNPKHVGALKYVHAPVPAVVPVPASNDIAAVIQHTNTFVQTTASSQSFKSHVDTVKTNANLEQDILEADQAIGMLQNDIADLRTQLAQGQEISKNNNEQHLSN